MRFLINFLKLFGLFIGYAISTYLIFELLKTYAIWLMPYLIWILLGLLIICICALAASWACHVEDLK